MNPETCRKEFSNQNTLRGHKRFTLGQWKQVLGLEMDKSNHETDQKKSFIVGFPDLKLVSIGPKVYFLCPVGYFNWKIHFDRFLGALGTKSKKNVKRNQFLGSFFCWIWPFSDLQPDPIVPNWYSSCPK